MTDRNFNAAEFERVALPYVDQLFRTAHRMINNRSDAEDVVQETFLQAWRSFHRFEPGTNCRAWLYKIMMHVIQHHRRKWHAKSGVESQDAREETLVYQHPIPDQVRDEDMLAALARVPPHYRQVVLLADVQEFAYKEIAEMLRIPIGTVMSRLSRGRKVLRAQLSAVMSTAEGRKQA